MTETAKTLGDCLDDLRRSRKLTLDEAAKRIGIAASVLHYYEDGSKLPGYKNFIKLAEFYDVSLDYLAGRVQNAKRKNVAIGERLGLSDTAVERLEAHKRLGLSNAAIERLEAHKQIEIPIDSGLLNIPLVLNAMLENEKFCSTFFPNFLKYFDKTACHNIFRSIVDNGIVDESTDERSLFYVGMTRALDRLLQDTSREADTLK